jgi:hypothetical protein
MSEIRSTISDPAEASRQLLEKKAECEKQGRLADATLIGAINRCVFRQKRDGVIVQRPASQIRRELTNQARALEAWRSEPPPICEIGAAVASRLYKIADAIRHTAPGRPQGVTKSPVRYLLNELAPLFAKRLAAAGFQGLAEGVLAKGQKGQCDSAGEATEGWQLFERFILAHAPQCGVPVTKAELKKARHDYRRTERRKIRI